MCRPVKFRRAHRVFPQPAKGDKAVGHACDSPTILCTLTTPRCAGTHIVAGHGRGRESAGATAHSRPPAAGGGGGRSLPQVCVLLLLPIERSLIHLQLATEVANGTPGLMCPAREWDTCVDSRTQRRIRPRSWMFLGIRLGDNGCGSLPDRHVSRLADGRNLFASVASNFRQGSANIAPPVPFNLIQSGYWPPRKVGFVLFLGCGRV